MCVLRQSIPPYDQKPFHFVETGINVGSFEELLYHCYHYWRESAGDFLEGRITVWVKETLKLYFIAGQMDRILSRDDMLSEKYLSFLSIESYFDKEDLDELESKIMAWENKSELDKLKLAGDERLSVEDYEKAAFYYNKLLTYGADATVYNNVGCCYMKLGLYKEAEKSFALAGDYDNHNYRIKLNNAMLYMLSNRSLEAEELLHRLQKTDNGSEVQYYLGELELRKNNLKKAKEYFKYSAAMGNMADSYAALCKIEMRSKNFEAAEAYLEKIPDKTSWQYIYNRAQLSYKGGNIYDAVINIEKLLSNFGKASYYTFAAKLYREQGEINKAQEAVEKALELDPLSDEAFFEKARIKKALGKPLEYQRLLKQITEKWRSNYKSSIH